MLYLTHREAATRVLGPGVRYAIWVQGCRKRCAGCINPEGQPLHTGGYWISEEELLAEFMANPKLTGITVSGGEPFLQAEGLVKLFHLVRQQTSLDIMVYTGYTLAELRSWKSQSVDEILADIDLLIDGEYREDENTNSIYRGSDNQVIHYMSAKYRPYRKIIEATKNRSVEFVFRGGDELFMVGIPAKDMQKAFWAQIGRR